MTLQEYRIKILQAAITKDEDQLKAHTAEVLSILKVNNPTDREIAFASHNVCSDEEDVALILSALTINLTRSIDQLHDRVTELEKAAVKHAHDTDPTEANR